MKLDPEEEDVHRRFRPLREGWRHVRTDTAKRVSLRVAGLRQADEPPGDEVVGTALRGLGNIVINLLRRLFTKKDD